MRSHGLCGMSFGAEMPDSTSEAKFSSPASASWLIDAPTMRFLNLLITRCYSVAKNYASCGECHADFAAAEQTHPIKQSASLLRFRISRFNVSYGSQSLNPDERSTYMATHPHSIL